MTDIVIKAEHLGKSYTIGHRTGSVGYVALRDVLAQGARGFWRKTRDLVQGRPLVDGDTLEEYQALQDVSFEVRRGETLGIIGRNGAGKSTLLKVLSRIVEPTAGRVTIRGRVASLLEVGTGFHPELTGRENIYLNGAILGMTRAEIRRKFDEIVAFAEVDKFLDTPVKRYSSGMYVRLAFAVAAHLEPEILVVDEVLAVGDAAFQKKCLGKMGDVAKEGRTVLFVSHNMAAAQQLCQSGMVLSAGKVQFLGDIVSAVDRYVQGMDALEPAPLAQRRDRKGNQRLTFTAVKLFGAAHLEQRQAVSGQDLFIRFYYTAKEELRGAVVNIAFNVRSSRGALLTNVNSVDVGKSVMDLQQQGYFQCEWPRFNLRSGIYDCALFCEVNGEIADWLQSAFTIVVEDGDFFGTGRVVGREQGDVLFPYDWSCSAAKERA